jgi:hypothetical protein
MWGKTTRLLVLCALATLALAGSAQARQVQQYFYSGEFFDAGGSSPAAIAFDGVDDKVLVVGKGDKEKGLKVSGFTTSGSPAPFSGLPGAPPSFNTGDKFSSTEIRVEVAADESATSSAGNFYLTSSQFSGKGGVYGYASDGTKLAGFPFSAPGACGIAVAPDGHLWVASSEQGSYREYTASGAPTGRSLFFGPEAGGCRIAFDAAGNLYLAKRERLLKYEPSGKFLTDVGSSGGTHTASRPISLDRAGASLFELSNSGTHPVTQIDLNGDPITIFGGPDPIHFSYPGLSNTRDLAVDSQTHDLYVLKQSDVDVFSRDGATVTVPSVTTGISDQIGGTKATLHATLDPDGIDTTECRFEWGGASSEGVIKYDNTAPCAEGNVFAAASGENEVSAPITGLEKGVTYHFRLSAKNANAVYGYGRDAEFAAADPPVLGETSADHITSDSARVDFEVNPNGAQTHYRVEIGADTGYGMSFPVPDGQLPNVRRTGNLGGTEVILIPIDQIQEVSGLNPHTLYHYRVVAENAAGTTVGDDHTFSTFALPSSGAESCPNVQARQQTSAAGLLDCRAYELVSAPYTGGYDVRSDLTPGIAPLATSLSAQDAALYSMRSGTIPGVAGNPTNHGADPYIATRGANGWSTRYVGLPSTNPFASGPFASPLSGFDSALGTFAFGGAEICSPCFEDGSTNVPLRLPGGNLVQGMAGSMQPSGPANSAGIVKAPLSADGSHFLFGSKAQFEPSANSNGTDATIYERDLKGGATEVISTDETGATIENGEGVAELGASKDGSRTVIGRLISTDAEGNRYYHLYLHTAGVPESIDLTPGATDGALYGGMSEDGSVVYFTTKDALTTATEQDTDTSADVYRDEIDGQSATLTRVSTGTGGAGDTDACDPAANSYNTQNWNVIRGGPTDCSAVAIGGGVSGDGSAYFLSPERLDGNGIDGAPNLYLAQPGASPRFVATLESSANKPLKAGAHAFLGSFGSFSNPEGVSIDSATGDFYVFDTDSTEGTPGAYVQKFDSAGNPIASFGSGGKIDGSESPTGEFLEYGEGAILGFPVGVPLQIAVDNDPTSPSYRDLYVADIEHGVIDKFDPSGAYVSQTTSSVIPTGIAVDAANGDLYAVGLFGEVEVQHANGAPPTTFSTTAGFAPNGIAVDSVGNSYITNGIETSVYDSSGNFVKTLDPNPSYGVTVDPADDHVYVDEGGQVVEFDAAGSQVTTIGSGTLSGSIGLDVHAGRMVVSNGAIGKVSVFGAATTPPDPGYNSPLVIDSVRDSGSRHPEEFQLALDGQDAVFTSTLPITGFDSHSNYEVYRYSAGEDDLFCVSCSPTGSRPTGDASLPSGLALTDDGRVFFTTSEALTLRDSNEKKDAYEWEEGEQELISTGTSENDSSLLSVSPDGRNAFFFTRQKLAPQDENGNTVRLYTAREEGGFEFGPPSFQCAASDECHGASTPAAAPLGAATTAGTPGQFEAEKSTRCAKGKVRRKGRCVRRHAQRGHQHKRARAERGGGR